MAASAFFEPGLFEFLTQLARNNRREWFEANKVRYEAEARDPLLAFVTALAPRLRKVAPRFVVDPSPVGGSMMRIYRDIRFARDKSPYKTALAAHFWHEARRDDPVPAFHLYLSPGRSSAGGGIWRPEGRALRRIRDAMVADPARWRKVTSRTAFRSSCGMVGESLKRVPPGYPADHPLGEDLRRRDFAISAPLTNRMVVSSDFMDTVADAYRSFSPFVRFLCEATGLRY